MLRSLVGSEMCIRDSLQHLSKRVKGNPGIPIPTAAIVEQFVATEPSAALLSQNLMLVYIKMGFDRDPPSAMESLPLLLTNISRRPSPFQATILRMLLSLLDQHPPLLLPPVDAPDQAIILRWVHELTLYSAPLNASSTAAPPPGLSADSVERLFGVKREWGIVGEELVQRKLGGLRLLKANPGLFSSPATLYPIFLAGSVDPNHAVVDYAEDYLRRTTFEDGLERKLAAELLTMYLGAPPSAPGKRDGYGPVCMPLKVRILRALQQFPTSPSQLPLVLKVIFEGMNGAHSCLLYTSDAADEEDSGDLGGRGII
eukprot:TRINITY_DN24928_c0_g1_i1.p1 TRINITY_DN24928_c0_g1~~TRINITY_DN24928_c0_g1_i1.p1  ORF type:complete len:343 (-),score=83.42 TRINITY_DN24928_c0_g1_i1:27-968(-)